MEISRTTSYIIVNRKCRRDLAFCSFRNYMIMTIMPAEYVFCDMSPNDRKRLLNLCYT